MEVCLSPGKKKHQSSSHAALSSSIGALPRARIMPYNTEMSLFRDGFKERTVSTMTASGCFEGLVDTEKILIVEDKNMMLECWYGFNYLLMLGEKKNWDMTVIDMHDGSGSIPDILASLLYSRRSWRNLVHVFYSLWPLHHSLTVCSSLQPTASPS